MSYPITILQNHEVGLHIFAHAQQLADILVAELAEDVELAPVLVIQMLVSAQQRFDHHQRLALTVTDAVSFSQEHVAEVTLT